jgi:hypothetical protein
MKKLLREQMKKVVGGVYAFSSDCYAKCADGTTKQITDCSGTCSCTDNVGCTCSGTNPVEKSVLHLKTDFGTD